MTNDRRHDWSVARDRIQQRMAELRLSPADLARASGLSEKHVRRLINGDGTEPRHQTMWAMCDALQWTPDSIDRILDGEDPLDADHSGELSRLDQLDGRMQEMEALATTGLDSIRTQQLEMQKFWRLLERLQGDVLAAIADRTAADEAHRAEAAAQAARLRALEIAIAELRQGLHQGDAGQL